MSDFTHKNIDFGSVSYSNVNNGKSEGYMIVFNYYKPIPNIKSLIKDLEEGTQIYNCWTIENIDKDVVKDVLSFSDIKAIDIMKKEYSNSESVNEALNKLKSIYKV